MRDPSGDQRGLPQFVPRALEAGVRSVHGLPLSVRTETIGSMDLIAYQPLDLSAADLATAQLLGDVTVSYLANSRIVAEKSALQPGSNYQAALRSVTPEGFARAFFEANP